MKVPTPWQIKRNLSVCTVHIFEWKERTPFIENKLLLSVFLSAWPLNCVYDASRFQTTLFYLLSHLTSEVLWQLICNFSASSLQTTRILNFTSLLVKKKMFQKRSQLRLLGQCTSKLQYSAKLCSLFFISYYITLNSRYIHYVRNSSSEFDTFFAALN